MKINLTRKLSWLSFICLLLTTFCLLLTAPTYAAMSGGGYSIPFMTIDGGGQTLSSDGYEVLDMKGQSVIGESADGRVGLGGIYGLLSTAEAPVIISDAGLIHNTWIERRPDGTIRLHWDYTPGIVSADIWRLSGDGRAFTSDTGEWPGAAIGVGVGATQFDDPTVRAMDGNNAYYRVVPAGTPQPNIFGSDPASGTPYNERTVGKIDVSLAANDLQLISMPMYSVPASETLSGQIPAGQEVTLYPQSGGGLDALPFRAGALAGDFDIIPNRGFWIQNDATARVITFVGRFINVETRDIANLDLTGNPLPLDIESGVLGGGDSDLIYPQSGGGLNVIRYSGGWVSPFTIGIGQGFWYQTTGSRAWDVNLTGETAEIISR
jgi:hypothetical protein